MVLCKLGFIVDQHICISNFHTTFAANLPLRISTTCTKRFMGYKKYNHVRSYIKLEFIMNMAKNRNWWKNVGYLPFKFH
jgi:hypothetical protein